MEIKLKALAKINLGLDVLGRRENGYHDVRMIMQTVYLYDDVTVRKTEESGIVLHSNLPYLPKDKRNIAYQAAAMLQSEFQIPHGMEITLKKRIPVAAGLAGGSSDAAAVLFGVNKLFHLGLSLEELKKRGVIIGADVPYCLMRGTVLAEGIGEVLTPISPMPPCIVVLAKPAVGVSTKEVYQKLDALEQPKHPNIDGLIDAISAKDLREVGKYMGNILEEVTIPDYPVIQRIKEQMRACGAIQAMMSGSGPTVFGLFEDKRQAKQAVECLKQGKDAKQIYAVKIHTNYRERR